MSALDWRWSVPGASAARCSRFCLAVPLSARSEPLMPAVVSTGERHFQASSTDFASAARSKVASTS